MQHAVTALRVGIALLLAVLLDGLGVPAAMLLAPLAVFAVASRRRAVPLPRRTLELGLLLIGATIGSGVTLGMLREFGNIMAIGAGIALAMIAAGIVTGIAAARIVGIDTASGIVATVPGGLPEMTAVSLTYGLRSELIIAVHLGRRVGVLLLAVLVASGTWG